MRKCLPPGAFPGIPTVGNWSVPLLPSSWGWRNAPFSPPPFTLGCDPERGPGPTSREEGVCVLDEGFHHAHHLDG